MRRRVDASALTRTLVIQTAFLGDVILTLPLLRALKKDTPVQFLGVVITPECADVLEGEESIDRVIVYEKRKKTGGSFNKIVKEITGEKFSSAFIPHRSFRSALLAWRAGIKTRVGFSTSPAAWLYTDRVPHHYTLPEVQRNLSLLDVCTRDRSIFTEWFAPVHVKQTHDGVRIVISPGTQWKTKMWISERYAEVITFCVSQGWRVDLCGGRNDINVCNEISHSLESPLVANHCGKTTIKEMFDIIGDANAVITNDSAPIHIANECGTPVIGIFGPTVPEFGFAPRGIYDQVVQTNGLICRPCMIHGGDVCPLGTHLCMKEISTDQVIEALQRVVALGAVRASR